MAARYFGINRMDREWEVTESASTTGKEVEVVIANVALTGNDAGKISRAVLQDLLKSIENKILKGIWPPA